MAEGIAVTSGARMTDSEGREWLWDGDGGEPKLEIEPDPMSGGPPTTSPPLELDYARPRKRPEPLPLQYASRGSAARSREWGPILWRGAFTIGTMVFAGGMGMCMTRDRDGVVLMVLGAGVMGVSEPFSRRERR